MLSRFFMYTDVHAHYTYTYLTYDVQDVETFQHFDKITEMQCVTKVYTFHTPHFIPRLIFVLVVSVNNICRLNISLCYPHYGKWATKRFFFFFCKSATRSPLKRK